MNNRQNNHPPLSGEMNTRGKSVLTSLKTAAKKALRPSSESDHSLSNAIAAVHIENSRILNRVGRFVKDEPSIEDPDVHETIDNRQGDSSNVQAISEESTTSELTIQDTPLQSISSSTPTILPSEEGLASHSPNEVSLPILSPAEQPHKEFFLRNLVKPIFRPALPKVGHRFSSTIQLAFAYHLLPREQTSLSPTLRPIATTYVTAPELVLNEAEESWVTAIEQDTAEQDHVRTLTAQVVAEFLNVPHKDVASITEIVLLGSVLKREDYRSVLSSLTEQLERHSLLKVKLLQGLTQFLQEASPGYLIDDDLIRILRSLRNCLKDTYKQSASDHVFYLVITICRVLDALVEGNIKGLHRTEDHKPLLDILTELRGSSNPHLKFHASYAWQALQYVGDDESPLHAALRFGGGLTMAALGVASVFKFDPENLFKGLQQLGQAAGQAYDVAKAGVEGTQALRAGGEGVMDSMLKGFRSGAKRAWYPALQGARVCIREGQLVDFRHVVYGAPCRREAEFQQGVCQLLGEVAMDPIWEIRTRQQAIDFLVQLHRSDGEESFDAGVKNTILGILRRISETAEQIIQDHTVALLQDMSLSSIANLSSTCLLTVRLPQPTASALLSKALQVITVEDKLQKMMSLRLGEYGHEVYIPPQGKNIRKKSKDEYQDDFYTEIKEDDCSNDAEDDEAFDDRPFSLLDKVMEFLKSDRQVFLILGDSGAGKSTFNKHLHYMLLKSYKRGDRIPLLISLLAVTNPEKELIQEQLKLYNFSEDEICALKQDRQFITICDGYDETQLSINLHSSNLFNRAGQWDVKMVISCRNTYLGKDYQKRFQPQPIDRYSPATPHLFQEATIVPFSSAEIVDYVRQFVRDKEVHGLLDGRTIWAAEKYLDMLDKIPKLMSLVTNPFLLVLVLRALPTIVHGVLDLKEVEVTRVRIYEAFITQWLNINLIRLQSLKLIKEETDALEDLIEEGFVRNAIKFLKDLALAIYKEQDGHPVVEYVHRVHKATWRAKFFGPDPEAKVLREASPLTRADVRYRFIHRSFLEYFYDFIEQNLRELKTMRLRDGVQHRYVPPLAKPLLQSSNQTSFPLMEKVRRFLSGAGQVFLLLGDSGAGKSTFSRHLESMLWNLYKRGGVIPLHINLPAINHPEEDLVVKKLLAIGFNDDQIQEMKHQRRFVLICDGYDECRTTTNLYESNQFNQPGQWSVKMVISCRSAHLNQDYQKQFQPQPADRRILVVGHLFEEATIVPFSSHQIAAYVENFVQDQDTPGLFDDGSVWSAREYTDKLHSIPDLMDLAKNPFLLSLTLKALPSFFQGNPGALPLKATRLMLFDRFIDQLIDISQRRLRSVSLPLEVKLIVEDLFGEGFRTAVLGYSKNLATFIVRNNDSNPLVEYSANDTGTWKDKFFSLDTRIRILREASPISQTGNQYQFIHRSFLEYFYSRAIVEEASHVVSTKYHPASSPFVSAGTSSSALSQGSIVKEPSIIQFLEQEVQQDADFKNRLLAIIELSKLHPDGATAAANAITVLVRAGERFNGLDLSGVRIPGADVSGGDFDSVRLAGADLTGATLTRAWFRHANFVGAQMRDVQFGEWPYLQMQSGVNICAYSPNGHLLAIGFSGGAISLFNTESWLRVRDLAGHNGTVANLSFSPDNAKLVSASKDRLVKLWNVETGVHEKTLNDQPETITCVVYSPGGNHIAVASHDSNVRVYDHATFKLTLELNGHTSAVKSVAYSPSGHLMATASCDWTVRLWDPKTGLQRHVMRGHTAWVTSVSISPTNNLVASSGQDMTVRMWNGTNGMPLYILKGHTAFVKNVSFSPSGHQLASGSGDNTVRLWDGVTGTPGPVLSGHTQSVVTLSYSPVKAQIATGSWDST
ncbi:hypothetical protein BGZ97_009448, partial [Linnemannia gamsii]